MFLDPRIDIDEIRLNESYYNAPDGGHSVQKHTKSKSHDIKMSNKKLYISRKIQIEKDKFANWISSKTDMNRSKSNVKFEDNLLKNIRSNRRKIEINHDNKQKKQLDDISEASYQEGINDNVNKQIFYHTADILVNSNLNKQKSGNLARCKSGNLTFEMDAEKQQQKLVWGAINQSNLVKKTGVRQNLRNAISFGSLGVGVNNTENIFSKTFDNGTNNIQKTQHDRRSSTKHILKRAIAYESLENNIMKLKSGESAESNNHNTENTLLVEPNPNDSMKIEGKKPMQILEDIVGHLSKSMLYKQIEQKSCNFMKMNPNKVLTAVSSFLVRDQKGDSQDTPNPGQKANTDRQAKRLSITKGTLGLLVNNHKPSNNETKLLIRKLYRYYSDIKITKRHEKDPNNPDLGMDGIDVGPPALRNFLRKYFSPCNLGRLKTFEKFAFSIMDKESGGMLKYNLNELRRDEPKGTFHSNE